MLGHIYRITYVVLIQ